MGDFVFAVIHKPAGAGYWTTPEPLLIVTGNEVNHRTAGWQVFSELTA